VGRSIRAAKRALARQLLRHTGVSGVGIDEGPDGERIKVYLAADTPDLRALVPESVEGFAVVVEAIGAVRPR
jgi:hypothetical protein